MSRKQSGNRSRSSSRNSTQALDPMVLMDIDLGDLAHRLLSFPADEYGIHPNLSPQECLMVCQLSIERFFNVDSCIRVQAPINIVGDIHGQFHDLLRIFDSLGQPPAARYLFLGDYIDRGKYSLEVMVLLLTLMLLYPDSVFLLRGNHEAGNVCLRYGFSREVLGRYGDEVGLRVLHGFLRCFQWLPVASLVNDRIFCCHGGVSPSFQLEPFASAEQEDCVSLLNEAVQRPTDVPQYGIVCDLLWADPALGNGNEYLHKFLNDRRPTRIHWAMSRRGCSYLFSQEALDLCLQLFGALILVRGHQVVHEGFQVNMSRRCITIFSAPGYCGTHLNDGAVLQIDKAVNPRKAGNFFVLRMVPNRPIGALFYAENASS